VSAVIEAPLAAPAPGRRSAGVWSAAARRFRSDRVGMVSLAVAVLFLLLVVASALGLVAKDWQVERGVPDAPPTFVGPRAPARAASGRRRRGASAAIASAWSRSRSSSSSC